MATVLDIGILQAIKPIFTFLFVWFIMFAVLEKTKFFGDRVGTNGVISIIVAFLFILTPGVGELINIATPWFFILIFLILFIVILFMMVGVQEEKIALAFQDNWVIWIILIIAIVGVFGFAASKVFGPSIQGIYGNETTRDEGFQSELGRVIFHPRVLGMFLLLAIASIAVRLISQKPL